jgi:glycosyltransferase involved in cell wall biosynthesis
VRAPSARRRVVLVTNGLVRAGTETQTVRLAAFLRGQGHDVRILSIMATAAFADELRELDVPVAHVRLRPRMRALSSIVSGWRVLRAWQPDALVSFSFQANMLGRIAGRLAVVPVRISSVRNERIGGRARTLLYRLTDFLATTTTTNSERLVDGLVRRRVARPDRLVVIPNGIDFAAIEAGAPHRRRARAELEVDEDDFLWLAMGRLHRQKDYPCLLAAFADLASAQPLARLRIAGEGPLLGELTALADRLGLADRVRFLGVRDDVPRLLAAADALVLASAWEGLPNVVLEAMAAGLPVVATDVGGVAQMVDDDRTGYLVPPRDPEALARAMEKVMSLGPPARALMGEQARGAVAAAGLSTDRVGNQWLQLIDSLCA